MLRKIPGLWSLGSALFIVVACGSDPNPQGTNDPPEIIPGPGGSVSHRAAQGGTGGATGSADGANDGASSTPENGQGPGGVGGQNERVDGGASAEPNGADLGAGGAADEPQVLALGECDLNAPFDAPVAAFTGTMNADGLTFSADGQTAYISGVGAGSYDIFVATRQAGGTFSTPTPVQGGINTSADQRAPSLSLDGQTLYLSQSPLGGYRDIAWATRTGTGQFGAATAIPNTACQGGCSFNSPVNDQDPFWWSSNTLLFASERPNGVHRDLYISTLNGSTFSPPALLQALYLNNVNTDYEDFRPVLSTDGLTLYFASKRYGIGGDTNGDVFMASRSSTDVPFSAPVNLWSMNSSGAEFPVTLSPDGCSLFFASNEEVGLGSTESYRLYESRRGPSTPAQVTVALNIMGTGSVTTPPFNCSTGPAGQNVGQCTASGTPGTTTGILASGQATWTGICTLNGGGQTSSDGVLAFARNGVCTIRFPGAPPNGEDGPCSLTMDCEAGLLCTNGTCQPAQCSNGVRDGDETGVDCGGSCAGCPSGGPCDDVSDCQSGLACTNGTCTGGHCTNQDKDGDETDVDCGGSCPPCPGGKVCNLPTDCAEGLICETNNGACFGQARDTRVCWPAECTDGIDPEECGQPESPCGAFCGCGVPCNVGDSETTCPTGEECLRDFGRVLDIRSRDACGPGGDICPSNDPELCGGQLKICGPHCICIPDCSAATPENPGDGCGGMCQGVCPIGLRGCCRQDFECASGGACLTDPDGVRTCRPTGPNGCDDRELKPPLCGTPTATCGPVCPTCEQDCAGRECGPDPNCGESCGTPSEGEYCDEAGQIRSATIEPPVSVPDGNGGSRDLHDIPRPPASGVGAIPGQFSVSDQGTAQYTIPISVPPGRAGMTPTLSLTYQATRDNGTIGVGWRIDGLSQITRCPKSFALDGYAAPVKNDQTDAFCLDGKRLHLLVPQTGPNPEYRTVIDSFARIRSFQDGPNGILPEPPAIPTADRSSQGPDWFEVRTKDGRILIYGGTRDSLVIGTRGHPDNQQYGIRQTWYLRQVRDRAGNTIDYSYDNLNRRFMNSPMPDARRPNIVHPRVITYTGHGNALGNRRVVFDYETRTDPALRFIQGGVVWSLQDRLKQITTYVDHEPVKNYRLDYDTQKDYSQVKFIKECEGATDAICKLPTSFEYEPYIEEAGFERHNAWFSGEGQLDMNGDGIPDYFTTEIKIDGVDARPGLVAAQVITDVAVAVGTAPFGPPGAMVNAFYSMASPMFWGMFAKEPDVQINHFLYRGTGVRANPVEGLDVSGIPCDLANSFQDYDRDGKDDLVAVCDGGIEPRVRIALSNGNGSFREISPLQLPLTPNSSYFDRKPVFYDIDGDSLVDVLSCADKCTLELRRRLSPAESVADSFAPPVRLQNCEHDPHSDVIRNGDPELFCIEPRTHAIFDIDGDGTPDLLNAWRSYPVGEEPSQGWRVLRYTNDPVSGPRLAWEDVAFADVDFSGLGKNLHFADFNSDGLQDVLYVKPTIRPVISSDVEGRQATIWLNTGNGTFMTRSLDRPVWDNNLSGSNLSTKRVVPADYNADGRMDWLEAWQDLFDTDGDRCNDHFNVAILPNSAISAVSTREAPNDLKHPSLCNDVPVAIDLVGDFDADGSLDLIGEEFAYYGNGRHNLLLKKIKDGLGNITTITYDGPGTYNENCPASTWPEQCLKRMTGLVSEHQEGHLPESGSFEVMERKTTYRYENAFMSTAGHGWIGFNRREVVEGPVFTGAIPTLPTPPETEASRTTTTVVMEPVARYTLSGEATTSTTPPYIYPFAGLPWYIDIDRTRAQTDLESASYRRRTRIENDWQIGSSTAARPFPFVKTRTTTVFEAEVGAADEGVDGAPLTQCTETMWPDQYGNIFDHLVICPDTETQTVKDFDELNSDEWLISNPNFVTIRSDRRGSPEELQFWDFNYFTNGLLESVARSPGGVLSERHSIHFTHDAFGNVLTSTEIVQTGEPSRVTSFTYDADNVYPRTITRHLPNQQSHTSEMVFDKRWGAQKTIVDPNGIAVQHAYDGLGLLSKTQSPLGTTTYEYMSANRSVLTTVGVVEPRITIGIRHEALDGTRTGTVFEELDYQGRSVLTTTEAFGGTTITSERVYDKHGRLQGATAPHTAGATVPGRFFSYDGLDRPKRVTHLPGDDTFSEIQHASRVTLAPQFWHWLEGLNCAEENVSCPVELELGIDEERKKDLRVREKQGLIIRNIDGEHVDLGEEATRASNYIYSSFNHLRRIRHNEPLPSPASTTLTDFVPDPFGRLLSHTDPDSGLRTYTYNGFDELKTSLDQKGQLRTFNYDDLGRVKSIVDPGVGTTEWRYDQGVNALGRLSETISPATTDAPDGQHLVYTYEPKTANNRGLLQTIQHRFDSNTYPVLFTYDSLGRPATIGYPDLNNGEPIVAKYSYDNFGFLTDVHEIGSGTPRPIWHMDEAFEGQLLQRETFGDGTTTAYTYNSARRFLETIDTIFAGDPIRSLEYTHYKNGLVRDRFRTRSGSGLETREHYYDALSRLLETLETTPTNPSTSVLYGYDHFGNLTQRGPSTLEYSPTKPHILERVDANAYQHDFNGNVEQRVGPNIPGITQDFSYTPFDLPSVITTGVDTTKFEYSADQQRLVSRETGPGFNRTRHFVSGLYQRRVDNLSGTTTEERFRLFAGSREIAQIARENGVDKTLYFHPDNLGTVDTITTSEGEVLTQDFDPFGSEIDPATTEATRVGFTGHQHDRELGLIDMKGRVYDPLAARFTTMDPIMQAPFWSQGLSRYAYVFNNPVNMVDPTGFTGNGMAGGWMETIVEGPGGFTEIEFTGLTVSATPSGSAPAAAPSGSAIDVVGDLLPALQLTGAGAQIAVKALNEGYIGQKSTRPKKASGGAGRAAPTAQPSPSTTSAADQNKPLERVSDEDLANTAGPHGHKSYVNPTFGDDAFKGDPSDAEFWEAHAGLLAAGLGGPEFIAFKLLSRLKLAGRLFRVIEPGTRFCRGGCENVARLIQKVIGGEIKVLEPIRGGLLGGVKNSAGKFVNPAGGEAIGWAEHHVVLKNGRVYDIFTGPQGMTTGEYKSLWELADNISFGF